MSQSWEGDRALNFRVECDLFTKITKHLKINQTKTEEQLKMWTKKYLNYSN